VKSIRTRLTYANVVSTIALFLVLCGATAFAATHLGKNSVGSKQLKKNAVTGAKIQAGAVTGDKLGGGAVGTGQLADGSVVAGKLANGSVTGGKLADGSVIASKLANGSVAGDKLVNGSVTGGKIGKGAVGTDTLADHSVTGEKLDAPSLPFSRVVQRIRGTTTINAVPGAVYPLDNPTYIQPVGEDDQYLGEFQAHFPATCLEPRFVTMNLFMDGEAIATGSISDQGTGDKTVSIPLHAVETAMARLAPTSSTSHTFSMSLKNIGTGAICNGGGTGMTITGAQIDVIGTR
jgi:hypothetical protein